MKVQIISAQKEKPLTPAKVQIISFQKEKPLTPAHAQLKAFLPEYIAESIRIVSEANNMLGIFIDERVSKSENQH